MGVSTLNISGSNQFSYWDTYKPPKTLISQNKSTLKKNCTCQQQFYKSSVDNESFCSSNIYQCYQQCQYGINSSHLQATTLSHFAYICMRNFGKPLKCTFVQVLSFGSLLFVCVSLTHGANSSVKRGVFGVGYGDDFEQFHGFGQNQVAALPVPLVPSSPVLFAKPILVSERKKKQ